MQGTGKMHCYTVMGICYTGILLDTLYYYWAKEYHFVLPGSSLYRGPLCQGSTI